jgi:hypothetical protein
MTRKRKEDLLVIIIAMLIRSAMVIFIFIQIDIIYGRDNAVLALVALIYLTMTINASSQL